MRQLTTTFLTCCILILWGCGSSSSNEEENTPEDSGPQTWEQTLQQAKGTTVQMMMWQGDPFINAYMEDYVIPTVQNQFGVSIEISSGQGTQIVSTLMSEQQARVAESAVDLVWINGETFFQLRQIDALYGPFTDDLPNSDFINWDSPFISQDFQQPTDGYECPWGNVQYCLIYNSEHVTSPPKTLDELEDWVKQHPGKFTFSSDFTGMTLLKSMLINMAGSKTALDGPFDEAKYNELSSHLWEYLNRIKPYFWREGKTFPSSVAPMHQLFSNGELWFTMSNNDGEVENKVLQGVLPSSSRAYVLEGGTIQNSHYLGVVKKAKHKAGAQVLINFLISPEAQLRKADPAVWGDGTVLELTRLPAQYQEEIKRLNNREFAPTRASIEPFALKEPDPEYMIRLNADFRKYVIEK
ncbi:MAG: ABC transporter substrate-binding protein [Flavobacteriales bacterium]|nr:ABC transporter substrate-binding protein [Flavobacteriales bacterium]